MASAISVGYFVRDSSITGNSLVLYCERSTVSNSLNLLPEATIEFFEELDNESTLVRESQVSPLLNYIVSPQSEHFIRCVFDTEVSDFLAIGGKQINSLSVLGATFQLIITDELSSSLPV